MNLAERLDSAGNYFRFLNEVRYRPWAQTYQRYVDGSLTLPQAAVLVHPMWREGVGRETPNRQQRSFTGTPPEYESCASAPIWGYDCTMATPLQTDHRFPWALGGPTMAANAVYLCSDHNLMKGHDVHLIDWTPQTFAWLHDEIEEVRRLVIA